MKIIELMSFQDDLILLTSFTPIFFTIIKFCCSSFLLLKSTPTITTYLNYEC